MPTGAPEGSDDYFVFVEGVVEMAGHLSQVQASESLDTRGRVGRPSSGEQHQSSQGVIELGGEDLPVDPINHQSCSRPTWRPPVDVKRTRRGVNAI